LHPHEKKIAFWSSKVRKKAWSKTRDAVPKSQEEEAHKELNDSCPHDRTKKMIKKDMQKADPDQDWHHLATC